MMISVVISRKLNPGPRSNTRVGNSSLIQIVCSREIADAPIRVLVNADIQTAGPGHHAAEIVTMMRLRVLVQLPNTELQLAGQFSRKRLNCCSVVIVKFGEHRELARWLGPVYLKHG